jgi:hypothetical protein
MLLYKTYSTYNDVPIVLFFWILLGCVYFNIFCYVSYIKLNILFEMVIKNEKLIKENKKIIEAFPHAVLIESEDNWYSNLEFDKKFIIAENKLDSLEKLLVKIDEDFHLREGEIQEEDGEIKTLNQLLKRQIMRLTDDDVTEQHSVYIKNLISNDENESREEVNMNESLARQDHSQNQEDNKDENTLNRFERGRFCNIKSMKVLWNWQPSVMHVFIDTTSILKLEEANNNIKCQKIMFSSASHEFRTPLNSILNAWDIVKECYKQVVKALESTQMTFNEK